MDDGCMDGRTDYARTDGSMDHVLFQTILCYSMIFNVQHDKKCVFLFDVLIDQLEV